MTRIDVAAIQRVLTRARARPTKPTKRMSVSARLLKSVSVMLLLKEFVRSFVRLSVLFPFNWFILFNYEHERFKFCYMAVAVAVNVQVNEWLVHSSVVFSIEDLKARERIIYLFLLSWIFDVKMKQRKKSETTKMEWRKPKDSFGLKVFATS